MQSVLKFQWHYSQKWKNNPKIHMEPQKALNSQAILRKKNKNRDITLPNFKL